VLRRIDVGAAGVIALEEQSVRRDDAGLILQRREADGGFRRRGQPRHVAADHVFDEFGWLAIRLVDDARPKHLRPWGIAGRRRLGGASTAGERTGAERRAQRQKTAAVCVRVDRCRSMTARRFHSFRSSHISDYPNV
jgi:hypothetical protein